MDADVLPSSTSKKRKRRAVLSCFTCRRRKLKCDREHPCDRCIHNGIANECSYEHEGTPEALVESYGDRQQHDLIPTSPAEVTNITIACKAVGTSPASRDEAARRYLYEDLNKARNSVQEPFKGTPGERKLLGDHDQHPRPRPLESLLKGHGYQTFLYGPTSPVTIVMHFSGLRKFMQEVIPDSPLARLQGDLKALNEKVDSNLPQTRVLEFPSLRSLMPDRSMVDRLARLYFETFETTYRILHAPSFWTKYDQFWEDPTSPHDVDAIILAILACTICADPQGQIKQHPNGSASRTQAVLWIKACQYWLRRQSNKHRSLESIQVRCILILAYKTACFKTKEFYQNMQSHFAFIIAIGLHRDPDLLRPRCSPFEAEIRRRLWATTMELELQSSINRGTPSSLVSTEWDCGCPRNINDSDLGTESQSLPLPRESNEYTDTSYLSLSYKSLPLRIRLCSLTNAIKDAPNLEEILQLEQAVTNELELLPHWPSEKTLQARTHLDLQLRQFLLILHTPAALQQHASHSYARFKCLESSLSLIDIHHKISQSGNSTLSLTRADYYRAALILCHLAYHSSEIQDLTSHTLRTTSLVSTAIEKALQIHDERQMRPGRGSHQYWYISAAHTLALTRLESDPSKRSALIAKATEPISNVYYKILALQEDPGEAYGVDEVIIKPPPSTTTSNPATATNALQQQRQPHGDALPSNATVTAADNMFSYDDASAWLLDDFWPDIGSMVG